MRVDQICMKGKEDELARKWEQLSLRAVAINCYEKELQVHDTYPKNNNVNKKDAVEPSLRYERERENTHATLDR